MGLKGKATAEKVLLKNHSPIQKTGPNSVRIVDLLFYFGTMTISRPQKLQIDSEVWPLISEDGLRVTTDA